MKRLFSLMIAILVGIGAGAVAEQLFPHAAALSAVPAQAAFVRTERDDGWDVHHFREENGTRYEVSVDPAANTVVKVEIKAADTRGAAAAVLTPVQAQEALKALYPSAVIRHTALECDDGFYEYDVFFTADAFSAHAELHAETGALLEAELNYVPETRMAGDGPLTAEEARTLVLTLADGGSIIEFETDRDDGRTVYEGEVRVNGVRYEFAIDADSGRVVEWERDN